MKKFLIFAVLVQGQAFCQDGTTREQAITIQPQGLCTYSDFITQGSEMWFKFVAQQEKISVELKSEKFGNNQSHIHQLKMYRGQEEKELAQDELPFNAESDKLRMNLNTGNLTPGETYYLKAERKARHDECNKADCKANNSTNPAQLKFCVQNVYPYIPNDFYGESPAVSHGYELHRGQVVNLEGEVANSILAFARQTTPEIYLGDHYHSFLWTKIDDDSLTQDSIQRVDMRFGGGSLHEKILFSEELPGHTNYYLAHNTKGILNNKSYSRIIRQDLYPNIDLQYYSNDKGLKMYFVIYPNGNHQDIKFSFEGHPEVTLTPGGGIKIKSALGEIAFKKALVYYSNPGENNVPMPSSGNFVQSGAEEYTIAVNQSFPKDRILIIQLEKEEPDPVDKTDTDPEWATYVGGGNTDYYTAIDMNPGDNFVYTAGTSKSSSFPTLGPDIFSAEQIGNFDGVVSVFDDNHQISFSTYLGGLGNDLILDLDYANATSVIYVTGLTNSSDATFPLQPYVSNPNAYQDPLDGDDYVWSEYSKTFVSRLNLFGQLEWHTQFVRSNTGVTDHNIITDRFGNIYVGGHIDFANPQITCSAPTDGNFPACNTAAGSYRSIETTSRLTDLGEAYLAKFDEDHNLVWSTVIGGEHKDMITDLAVDNQHLKLIVVGGTDSRTTDNNCQNFWNGFRFPQCNNNPDSYIDNTPNGPEPSEPGTGSDPDDLGEAFLMKFTFDGILEYSSLIGGNHEDIFMDVDIDQNENIYVVGTTQSQNSVLNCWPPTNGSLPICEWIPNVYYDDEADAMEIFVAKFNGIHQLVWSSYLGGLGKDAAINENHYLGEGWPSISVNFQTGDFYVAGTAETGSVYGAADYQFPIVDNQDYYNQVQHADYVQGGIPKTDKFVTHFTSDLRMDWSTYFGGESPTLMSDFGGDIVTENYKVYLCGGTTAINEWPYLCPSIPGAIPYCQGATTVNAAYPDAFVAQLVIDPTLGIKKIQTAKNSLLLHPNPSNSGLTLGFNSSFHGVETVHFFNQLGQVVFSKEIQVQIGKNEIELELENLSKGIYVVTLRHNPTYRASKWVKL